MEDADNLVEILELDAEEEEIHHEPVHFLLVIIVPMLIFMTKITGPLSAKVSKLFFKATENEKKLMKTAVNLKNEMRSVSMVDEFAKYAKIQRRLNQVNLDLEATVGCRYEMQTKLRRILSVALYITIAISTAILMYNFRDTPVFIIPENWFYPLSAVMSYPTGIPGGISVVTWTLLVRSVSSFVNFKQS